MQVDRVERTHRNAIMGATVAPPPPPHVNAMPPDAYPTMGTVSVPVPVHPVMGRVQRTK